MLWDRIDLKIESKHSLLNLELPVKGTKKLTEDYLAIYNEECEYAHNKVRDKF